MAYAASKVLSAKSIWTKLPFTKETLFCIVRCFLDLIVAVVETGDCCVGELGDLTGRATEATPGVQDRHVFFNADPMCEVMLMAGNCLQKGLIITKSTEVQ